jgi:hydrogenase maturation protease
MPDLLAQLGQLLQGRVCLLGLGNLDYGDDGLGVRLTEAVTERLTRLGEAALAGDVVTAGAMPERFIGRVMKADYDQVLVLDAVEFGGEPGSVLLLGEDELHGRFPQISTHKISVALLARLIAENNTTSVQLLGVQPGSLKPGQGLSPTVQRTVSLLVDVLCPLLIAAQRGDERVLTHAGRVPAQELSEVNGS